MPVLLYAVAGSLVPLDAPSGVANSPVCRLEHSGVAIFYSESDTPEIWLRAPLSTSVMEFHRVQKEIFRSSAIVPFRFPAILDSKDELLKHLDERSGTYKDYLQRFAGCAQMDLSLTHANAASPPSSGTAYLHERQSRTRVLEQFAKVLRDDLAPLITDWRERSIENGLRCFALVARKQVEEFNEKIKTVSVPPNLSVRVGGPWPVAEFLDFKL